MNTWEYTALRKLEARVVLGKYTCARFVAYHYSDDGTTRFKEIYIVRVESTRTSRIQHMSRTSSYYEPPFTLHAPAPVWASRGKLDGPSGKGKPVARSNLVLTLNLASAIYLLHGLYLLTTT